MQSRDYALAVNSKATVQRILDTLSMRRHRVTH